MAFSTILHLFCGMSESLTTVLSRLDYAGICFLIFGSVFPPYYYSFKCTPVVAYTYIGILFVASSFVFVVSMMPKIHHKEHMKLKGFMYSALGLFAAFPLGHLLIRTYCFLLSAAVTLISQRTQCFVMNQNGVWLILWYIHW